MMRTLLKITNARFRRVLAASLLVGTAAGFTACTDDPAKPKDPNDLAKLQKVLKSNADIARAAYGDALTTAIALQAALDKFVAAPTEENFKAAKIAWLVAREPYGQTEAYRFRNSPIDSTDRKEEDGPELQINAWPLGEALIDYVKTGNDFGHDQVGITTSGVGIAKEDTPPKNIINTPEITIDEAMLSKTAQNEDERDVLAGYHAIEFLLWGQDLNADGSADTKGKRDATAGHRPLSDYALDDTCTTGADHTATPGAAPCKRRGEYLKMAAKKLVSDLQGVVDNWKEDAFYTKSFVNLDGVAEGDKLSVAKENLGEIIRGMGTLAGGELAGERMQIALSADSQEDEHSCFSDNTHRDIYLNAEGVANAFYGTYGGYWTRDGDGMNSAHKVDGYGIYDYLKDIGMTTVADDLKAKVDAVMASVKGVDTQAKAGKMVDQIIMDPSSPDAKNMIDGIQNLDKLRKALSDMAIKLKIKGNTFDTDSTACDPTNPTKEC